MQTARQKRKRSIVNNTGSSKHHQTSQSADPVGSNEEPTSSEDELNINLSSYGDEQWIGFSGENVQDDGNQRGRGSKPTTIPAGHQVRVMKEATELYQSSSFKLKIDSLLPTVRPKYNGSAHANLESVLFQLHKFISSMSPVPPQHPLDAAKALLSRGVAVPYSNPLPTEDTKWKVAFQEPADIRLVGSWANKLAVKAQDGEKFTVDVAVEMPDTLFQEKDYLNGRFFNKRAFYLATIAAALKEKFPADLFYHSTFGDPRLTTLILWSREDKSQTDFSGLNAQIRIIPTLQPTSPISLKYLSPSRCNIRTSASKTDLPTPRYNSALALCSTPVPHLLANHALKKDVKSFEDAFALLRVWANQRGYGEGTKGWCVHGFEGRGAFWSGLLALLIMGDDPVNGSKRTLKPIGRGLSSYQLFKSVLGFLARHDFEKEPIYVKTGHKNDNIDDYRALNEPVLFDSTCSVNLVSGIPISSLQLLRQDARVTTDCLDSASESDDPFLEAFLQEKRDLSTRFDAVIQVDLSTAKQNQPSDLEILDIGSPGTFLLSSLTSVLSRGLNKRTKAFAVLHHSSSPRALTYSHPFIPSIIQIGLILDPEHAFRLVDHGPSVEDADVNSGFRDFWGDKAELRRFKDGSITESVVWDVKTQDEKARIPSMIVKHLLHHHFAIEESAIKSWQSKFDDVLRLPSDASGLYDRFDPKIGFKAAMTAFDTLVKQIKELTDLPLAVLNVSPVCDQLRHTAVFIPVAIPATSTASFPPWMRYLSVMDIVLEFERSAKWPDELDAIQKMKLAFFEEIARSIMRAVKGASASVVVGHPLSSDIEDHAMLEIVTADGWAFRTRIWHDREAILLDRIIDAQQHLKRSVGDESRQERARALKAKEVHFRRFIHAPKHHRAIMNLCHRYAAFAGTVRLAKRWFASHWLLEEHVSSEAVELICAKIFIGNGKGSRGESGQSKDENAGAPMTKERGFAQVIEFLMRWRWEDGLVIPIYDSRDIIDSQAVQPGLKSVAWKLSTEEDISGKMWTSDGPDAVIARRVTSFAGATWNTLKQGVNTGTWDAKTIYTHPISDYDFVIQLDSENLPRTFQNVSFNLINKQKKAKYANLQTSSDGDKIRPGFDPALLFLQDLKRTYSDTLLFFKDVFGGDRIGAIWLPSLAEPRPFKVLSGYSSLPVSKDKEKSKDKQLVALNKAAVLAEIARMGTGLIKVINV